MRSSFLKTQCLLLLYCLGSFAVAQEDTNNETPLSISRFEATAEEIIVVEDRPSNNSQIGDVILEIESAFYNVIPRDSFENKITDLAQVLTKATSIQVQRDGGLGSFASVSLRGSSGARLPVYVDGMLLNESSNGSVNINSISLNNVEQIEVYRGLVPMNFSSASIAGAINIRTRRINKPESYISYGTGSFATQKLEGSYASKKKQWDYLFSASHVQSQNNYPYTHNNGTQFNSNDDYETERKNNAYSQNNVLIKLNRHFKNGEKIILSVDADDEYKQLPTWNNSEKSNTKLKTSIINGNAKWLSSSNESVKKSVTIGWRTQRQTYDDRESELGLSKQYVKYLTQRRFANVLLQSFWKNHIITTTTEVAYDNFAPESLLGGNEFSSSSRWSGDLGLQVQSLYFSDKLILSPGIRYYFDESHRNENAIFPAIDTSNKKLSSQLGLQWNFNKWLKIKANIANYYRSPTFYELFSDRGTTRGNPDLLSENGLTMDVGLEVKSNKPVFIFDSSKFSLSYYQSIIKDAIVWSYNSQGVGFPDNVSRSNIQGIEFEAGFEVGKIFSLESGLNLQEARIESDNPVLDNKLLPGIAMVNLTNQLKVTPTTQWRFIVELSSVLGRFYDSANLLPVDDQIRLNSSVSWKPSAWQFDLELKNLLNEIQEDHYLNPIPGRALYFTIRYQT